MKAAPLLNGIEMKLVIHWVASSYLLLYTNNY